MSYGNEGDSSSVNNLDRYIIIRKFLDPFSSIYFWYWYPGRKFKPKYTGAFFRKVAYKKYGVPWFVAWMDYTVYCETDRALLHGQHHSPAVLFFGEPRYVDRDTLCWSVVFKFCVIQQIRVLGVIGRIRKALPSGYNCSRGLLFTTTCFVFGGSQVLISARRQ
jgi:hypothetical protein